MVSDLREENDAYREAVADKLREVAEMVLDREVIEITLTWEIDLGESRS
jgi:hypothetical protein